MGLLLFSEKKVVIGVLFQLDEPIVSKFDTNIKAIDINRKDQPILSMTPKQVTHVRICQRLLVIAQQPQTLREPAFS